MNTIINNPSDRPAVVAEDTSGVGLIVGILVGVVLVALFFVYALPAIRNNQAAAPTPQPAGANINVTLPGDSNSAPSGNSNSAPSY